MRSQFFVMKVSVLQGLAFLVSDCAKPAKMLRLQLPYRSIEM